MGSLVEQHASSRISGLHHPTGEGRQLLINYQTSTQWMQSRWNKIQDALFGPVLTCVPPVADAAKLWQALTTISEVDGFASVDTRRDTYLDTGQ